MDKILTYIAAEADDGQTLGTVLRSGLGLTARQGKQVKFLPDGLFINGERFRDGRLVTTRTIVRKDDHIRVKFQEKPETVVPFAGELAIVYEDEDILVINKGANVPIHPSKGYEESSLANGVMHYYEKQGVPFVFRSVNRLDQNTTGLVIVAKNMFSGAILCESMRKREIHRTYLAITEGEIPENGTITFPIGRREGSAVERCIDENGQSAVTHYEKVSYANGHSLAKIQLETGRTHQIRLHMRAIGHPLPADALYNPNFSMIDRHALHSWKLEFPHPITKEIMSFEQELPEDMRKVLE